MNIQEIFNSQKGKIKIPMGEYKGPLVINKECVIDGSNATVWTKDSPVILIEADNVIIKNLKVELTKGDGKNIAIIAKNKNVDFENVEVFGEVEFFDKTATKNNIPRIWDLGEFKADTENIFVKNFVLNDDSEIANDIYGLKISPSKLKAGNNNIELKISPLRQDTIIYGSLVLKSKKGIIKRVYVTGKSQKNAPKIEEKIGQNTFLKESKTNSNGVKNIIKGERIILRENEKNFMVFSAQKNAEKVDPYIFLLYENGKTKSDEDLIFFGNKQSKGIYLEEKDGLVKIVVDLVNIPKEVKKIAATFAVYDEGSDKKLNFYSIKNPEITFYVNDKPSFRFPLNLTLEKAINAVEIYRHKGIWKANFIGAGFTGGIRELCKMFGISAK